MTDKTEKAKKAKEKKEQEDFGKVVAPVEEKKGLKGEIAREQLEAAFSSKNIKDGGKFIKKDKSIDLKKVKKIVKAAGDDKQLERTKRSMSRHGVPLGGFKSGGRAGYKGGKSVKKKGGCAIKGKSPILR